jgi:flagellar biosynthesis/type III secretory pathway ATPase
MDDLVTPPHRDAAHKLRAWLAHYEHKRELFELGALQPGSDPLLDHVVERLPAIRALLGQDRLERAAFADTVERLIRL